MSYNILVMDSGYKHTLGIIRALGREGYASYVLSNKSGSLASKSKYCKGEVVVGSLNNDIFIQTMVRYNIACVLPVGINSFKQCYKLQDFFKVNNIFPFHTRIRYFFKGYRSRNGLFIAAFKNTYNLNE